MPTLQGEGGEPRPAGDAPAPAALTEEQREKRLEDIRSGLRINWMSMQDAETGEKLWHQAWDDSAWDGEQLTTIPKEILECEAVTRALSFSSKEKIEHLRMSQKVLFHGQQIEEWNFTFGFVIPESTNEWSSTVQAAKGQMMQPEDLSGNIVIETHFFDGDSEVPLRVQKTRCHYS
eukprot:Hpha_TRINITY_DN17338_c0_g1::TRINITY_DN17338_c0_g1_i1::g.137926::m.137926/K13758/PDE6D; retinal rod rhodopsin-sensitive cGMP 3',5'-cyclic phosphodiesterase subunit delta